MSMSMAMGSRKMFVTLIDGVCSQQQKEEI